MTSEKSHTDIFKRLEKVEIDVAVLDSKSNRLHQDMVDIKADVKINSELTRVTQAKVDSIPRIIITSVSVLGFFMSVLVFFVDKVLI